MAEQATFTTPARAVAPAPTPAPARAPRVRVRRNVRWLAAGILAVTLGGLGTWALFTTVADTRPVLKVNKTLYRGQTIAPADLSVIAVGRNTDLPAVSGDEFNAVVGKAVITDLPAGSLLVRNSYGEPELAPGLARIGLKLDPGRIPSGQLKPGTRVVIVPLPGAGGGGTANLPAPIEARLANTPVAGNDGSYSVDINVNVTDADTVARLAGSRQVSIYQKAES